jgi:hypothetical protein
LPIAVSQDISSMSFWPDFFIAAGFSGYPKLENATPAPNRLEGPDTKNAGSESPVDTERLQLSGLSRIIDPRNRQHLHFEKRKTAIAVTTNGFPRNHLEAALICEKLTSSNVG